jgi:AcrR family transcriptional regulator
MTARPKKSLTDRSDRIRAKETNGQPVVSELAVAGASVRVGEILEAACRVVARDGAHGLHMKAVAEEAGVSKALIHYYFATRQELLRRTFVHAERHLDRILDEELAEIATGAQRLERTLMISLDADSTFGERRVFWNEVWSSVGFDEELRPLMRAWYEDWLARLVAVVEEGRADGSIPRSVDARTTAWRLGAVADGVDSLLYLGIVSHDGAAEMIRTALARELA